MNINVDLEKGIVVVSSLDILSNGELKTITGTAVIEPTKGACPIEDKIEEAITRAYNSMMERKKVKEETKKWDSKRLKEQRKSPALKAMLSLVTDGNVKPDDIKLVIKLATGKESYQDINKEEELIILQKMSESLEAFLEEHKLKKELAKIPSFKTLLYPDKAFKVIERYVELVEEGKIKTGNK